MKTLVDFIKESGMDNHFNDRYKKFSYEWCSEVVKYYGEIYFENNFKASELNQEFEDIAENKENARSYQKLFDFIVDDEELHIKESELKSKKNVENLKQAIIDWAIEMLD